MTTSSHQRPAEPCASAEMQHKMHVLAIRPVYEPAGGGFLTLCGFDLVLNASIRLYGMRLVQAPDGRRLTYVPWSGGRRFATFAPDLAEAITTAAVIAFEQGQVTANDHRAA